MASRVHARLPVASGLPTADILIGGDPELALAVQVADCVPLLIVDRESGATAAVHAGWRGLAAAVPRLAVEALQREFGCRPGNLMVAAGPSIGPCCYEVGPDVSHRFAVQFGADTLRRWFSNTPTVLPGNPSLPNVGAYARPGHSFLDCWAAARDQLETCGVPADQIFVAGLCTASHPEALCSYRRDGATAGRLAAAIRIARRGP
jgi:YfiH family protein